MISFVGRSLLAMLLSPPPRLKKTPTFFEKTPTFLEKSPTFFRKRPTFLRVMPAVARKISLSLHVGKMCAGS